MTRKQRETETFSLSFLDAITCAFGAVILLLVLTKIFEPQTIERSKENLAGLIAALQAQLFELRGETAVLNRDLLAVEEQLSESKQKVARLSGDVSKIRGQFAATTESARIEDEERGELEGARQRLLADMPDNFVPERAESIIGGIPVDSQYIIFVIDRSGSMQGEPWKRAGPGATRTGQDRE